MKLQVLAHKLDCQCKWTLGENARVEWCFLMYSSAQMLKNLLLNKRDVYHFKTRAMLKVAFGLLFFILFIFVSRSLFSQLNKDKKKYCYHLSPNSDFSQNCVSNVQNMSYKIWIVWHKLIILWLISQELRSAQMFKNILQNKWDIYHFKTRAMLKIVFGLSFSSLFYWKPISATKKR